MDFEIKPLQKDLIVDCPVQQYLPEAATVQVANNKLILSKDAVKALRGVPKCRIAINYWNVDKETTFPCIGRSELFTEGSDGNKLTKSNTVSFRGQQRDILLQYGKSFKLVPFKGFFKMEPYEEVENQSDFIEEDDFLEQLTRDLNI